MSYHEALADGVRIEKCDGTTVYYPPCMFCGQDVFSWHYIPRNRYICTQCKPMQKSLLKTGLFPLPDKKSR